MKIYYHSQLYISTFFLNIFGEIFMIYTNSCVLLLSGGLDSVTLLHYLVKKRIYQQVYGLTFLYGQKHSKEVECAKWQMNFLNMQNHQIIDLNVISPLLQAGSALIRGGKEIPRLDEIPVHERLQSPTYVPNRNMIFLSIAAAWAEAMEISEVFYSAHIEDEYGYWDCTKEFVEKINNIFSLNRKHKITVEAPFLKLAKKKILEIGHKLEVDYSYTWSCYRGEEVACGNCPTCVERLKAFASIGLIDPLPYQKH